MRTWRRLGEQERGLRSGGTGEREVRARWAFERRFRRRVERERTTSRARRIDIAGPPSPPASDFLPPICLSALC